MKGDLCRACVISSAYGTSSAIFRAFCGNETASELALQAVLATEDVVPAYSIKVTNTGLVLQ